MQATTRAAISEELSIRKMNHAQDFTLTSVTMNEYGDMAYQMEIKTWPAIKLATRHFCKAYGRYLVGLSFLTAVALLLIIFGG